MSCVIRFTVDESDHAMKTAPEHKELTRVITLLSDAHEALEHNSYLKEAEMVSRHLRQLSNPRFRSRVKERGIDLILAELARGFSPDK